MEGLSSDNIPVRYILDTSALIRLDVDFPKANPVFRAVWEEMEDMVEEGILTTIDYVEDEINSYAGKEGFLKEWVKERKRKFVVKTTESAYLEAIPLIRSEYASGFFDAKKLASGTEEADPYLIGQAKATNAVLITMENAFKPNKIPKVAAKFGVNTISNLEFIQARGLLMIRRGSRE